MPQPVDPSDLPHGTAQEPSTPPAQQPHDAPAGDDGHPGTPDGPVVLGRALLDPFRVWRYDLAKTGRWSCGDGQWLTKGEVEARYGPVREVLLVPLEVGRVLEAVQAWHRVHQEPARPDHHQLARWRAASNALAVAWDALRESAPTCRACGVPTATGVDCGCTTASEPAPEPAGDGMRYAVVVLTRELGTAVAELAERTRERDRMEAERDAARAESDRLARLLALERQSTTWWVNNARRLVAELDTDRAELQRLRGDLGQEGDRG